MLEVNVFSRGKVRAPRKFATESTSRILRVLKTENIASSAMKKLNAAKEISLVFVDGRAMKRLNRDYRRKNKATDILSFAPSEDGSLGELVIALDIVRTQAKEHGLSLHDELTYMILHGVLHLLAYDHELSEAHARRMFRVQDRVFEKLRAD